MDSRGRDADGQGDCSRFGKQGKRVAGSQRVGFARQVVPRLNIGIVHVASRLGQE
jgi:hypothetical protein